MPKLATAALFCLVAMPALAQTAPPAAAPGTAPTAGNPNLAVATIKLESGKRLGALIGATVYSQDNKELGKVDDLIMTNDDKVSLAVISVGGFLGVGSKLVAFPFKALSQNGDRIVLADATAESLNAMPNFQY